MFHNPTADENDDQLLNPNEKDAVQNTLWNDDDSRDNPVVAKLTAKPVAPPLKWHGGKHYLAEWIISLMPAHSHYFEPFFGGGAVLLAKNPHGVNEMICDKCQLLMNFWATLQSDDHFQQFARIVDAVPFSEQQFEAAREITAKPTDPDRNYATDPDAQLAVAFFIVCRQSMAGRMDCFAPATTGRLRRGMNEQTSAWLSCVDRLPEAAARLKRVFLHKPQSAVPLIQKYDKPDLLMYLDPPYPRDTRTSPNVYEHEMTTREHRELLAALRDLRHAKVLLSSYPNDLYNTELHQWNSATRAIDNKASSKRTKSMKMERVYMNY